MELVGKEREKTSSEVCSERRGVGVEGEERSAGRGSAE